MSRYKYTKLLKLGPVDGFMIHTPDDRKLRDTHPQTIVRELNRLNQRIKRLEGAGDALLWYFRIKNTGDISFLQSETIKQWNQAKEAKL